ncbi:hypothetical protein BD779DRAFT_1557225 [Infundibulicybe gibba]|nr:hypothetical protein BD779DRAFT_1557225 [Infundibulicybe gibba]
MYLGWTLGCAPDTTTITFVPSTTINVQNVQQLRASMRWSQIPRSFFALILPTRVSNAAPANQTIDDGFGVQYSPSAGSHELVWKSQDTCGGCLIAPNRTKAYNNTWSSAISMNSENVTARFSFQGTAIYIYFIIPNLPFSIVNCDFLVDGRIAGNYTHAPHEPFEFQYNTLVYANTSLSDTLHTFMIQAKSIVIFDYAQYTTDIPVSSGTISAQPESPKLTNTTSTTTAITTATTSATSNSGAINASAHSSTPAGVIIGSVIGGVVGIGLIVLGVILYRRHTRGRISLEETESEYTIPSMLQEKARPERKSSDLRMGRLLVEIKQLATQQYLANSGGSRQTETSGEEMWVVADQPAGQHGGSGYSNTGAHAY